MSERGRATVSDSSNTRLLILVDFDRYCLQLKSLRHLPVSVEVDPTAFFHCDKLAALAKAKGFFGPHWDVPDEPWHNTDLWVRSRRIRFTLLACVRRAREMEDLDLPVWIIRPAPLLEGLAKLPDDVLSYLVDFIGDGFDLDEGDDADSLL